MAATRHGPPRRLGVVVKQSPDLDVHALTHAPSPRPSWGHKSRPWVFRNAPADSYRVIAGDMMGRL